MADASRLFAPIARERSQILDLRGLTPRDYVVVTIHREANVQPDRLRRIVDGLNSLGETIVFPAHPRTRAVLEEIGGRRLFEIGDPLGYLDLTALASQARVILTDSGGLQKEAYWYGVPCVTVRPSTEWVDTVAAGANRLVEPEEVEEAVADASFPTGAPPLYGDGHASEQIAAALYASGP